MYGMRRLVVAGLALVGLLRPAAPAHAQVAVAAASDLQVVLPAIAREFQQRTGVPVRISYGSSGQFVAQIQNGAPFDLFLSADQDYVDRLVTSGHGRRDTVRTYASGRLALWARRDRQVDVGGGLAVLGTAQVRRIALANPEHAPYGRAALAAITQAGLAALLKPKLVLGENVAQAAQFVQSGNADAGLIALSLARAPALQSVGVYWEVPASAHPPLRQTGVVLTRATQADAASRFLAFLAEPRIADLLRASGFGGPR